MENRVTSEDKHNLAPLWNALIELYLVFSGICKKYKLRYYAAGGTVLGAIRHKGFIPWDDDFDLVMPRPDYELFKRLAANELPAYLRFVDRKNAPELYSVFGKIQDTRRDVVLKIEDEIGYVLSSGIYLDIFPIDGYPAGVIASKIWRIKVGIAEAAFRFNVRHKNVKKCGWRGALASYIGAVPALFLPQTSTEADYKDFVEKRLMSFPYDNDKWSGISGIWVGGFQRVIPPHVFGPGIEVPFEAISVRVPSDWDTFLKVHYGNYMQMPPEDKQVSHHALNCHCPWWLGPTIKDDATTADRD